VSRLRRALLADALLTVVSAPTFVLLATPIATLTGLPPGLIRGAGAFLAVWALWFVVVLRRDPPRRGPLLVVLVVNSAWVAGAVAVAMGAVARPTVLGVVLVLGQSAVVAVLTVLQVGGPARGVTTPPAAA
jgi:hypothetical protein